MTVHAGDVWTPVEWMARNLRDHRDANGEDEVVLIEHFPLMGLRLTTPRLELRLPSLGELAELADLAAGGIRPDVMPFVVPWTDHTPAEVARGVVLHHWRWLGGWTPKGWSLNLTVIDDGVVVGQQSMGGRDLAVVGEVSTGSWLGMKHHRRGIGTEMRAAVLHLAFAELGAVEAVSAAFESSAASHAVSAKLGYEPDGINRRMIRGVPVVERRLRLTRSAWERNKTVPVAVHGVAPCLPLFGIDAGSYGSGGIP